MRHWLWACLLLSFSAYTLGAGAAAAPETKTKEPPPLVYGPVKEGETLWHVAKAFSTHYKMPLDSAMDKLYEHNQRSFVSGKRDALMAGSYLRLPEKPLGKAVNQKVAKVAPELPKLEEEGKAVAVNLEKVTGSLELLMPTNTSTKPIKESVQTFLGKDEQAFNALLEKIQAELSFSREAIDTERRAKEALQSQLSEVQIQIKALTELIYLKDTEIKSLLATSPLPPAAPIQAQASRPLFSADLLSGIANNQLALLFMAIAVASFMVYVWDHFALRRAPQQAAAPQAPARQSSAIKTQSLQAPAFALQDVDVYLAHGRYSQAEELLEQALEHQPNDFDVLYKLFQVYVKSDNRQAYEAKTARISLRWKQKYPTRWKRVQDLYERAWPMNCEGHDGGIPVSDEAYEGDPPSDPVQTKLDLAKAYLDIGNHENAVEILMEVVNEGSESQILSAQMLLSNIKH